MWIRIILMRILHWPREKKMLSAKLKQTFFPHIFHAQKTKYYAVYEVIVYIRGTKMFFLFQKYYILVIFVDFYVSFS